MKQHFLLKLLISLVAFVSVIVHLLWPALAFDAITIGLLVIMVLPWLSPLIESVEFPWGWKVCFREIQDEQKRQRIEIDSLNFLVSHFLTDDELKHLKKLDSGESFPFVSSSTTVFFEQELRHLRALRLIKGLQGKGVRTLLKEKGDVKDHFRITDRGQEYLRLREQSEKNEEE